MAESQSLQSASAEKVDIRESIRGDAQEVNWGDMVVRAFNKVADFFRVAQPDEEIPVTIDLATDLLQRKSLNEILAYRDIDQDGYMVIEDGKTVRLGFVIAYSPVLLAGKDLENTIASLIGEYSKPGTVIQFGVLSHRYVTPILDQWQMCRSQLGEDTVYARMARYRRNFLLSGTFCEPLAAQTSPMSPKDHIHFLAVTIPFDGDITSEFEWETFYKQVKKQAASTAGGLDAAGMSSMILDRTGVEFLLRLMLNPHMFPDEVVRADRKPYPKEGISTLVDKRHRLITTQDGSLDFSDGPDRTTECRMVPMTMDFYPRTNGIQLTNRLMGNIFSTTERINAPFYLYLNIQVLDTPKTKERLLTKKASVSRQLISDSPVMRALASGLFKQRDELEDMISMIEQGKKLIGLYMGINVWDYPENIDSTVGAVRTLWANHGFAVSPERFIGLPIWIASLPMHFYPHYDEMKNNGLQRMSTMTTAHASYLAPVQGGWKGTPPEEGGLLLVSRQNQLATFNIQGSIVDNYNFSVFASSGAGKSFFAQEIVMDFLAKGGIVFIIDAGRSYYDLCELLGGTNLEFKFNDPMDLNPFAYIKTREDLAEGLELLKSVTLYMMFPNQIDRVPDWQDKLVEHALEEAWNAKRDKATYADVRAWLERVAREGGEQRAKDMADQLRPYTEGRFKDWFNGTARPADLNNNLVVIEMDDLKSQGSFRDVVLTMMMNRIAETMYKTKNPSQPKLMLIDEAWDLLGSNQAGDFINRAYRTYRKYGGSAGIITQSFKDIKISKASEAAYNNSSWTFALKQNPDAYNQAIKEGVIAPSEVERDLVTSVYTSKGNFSEIYVKTQNGGGVYRFFVDPFSYWLFTTAPKDKAKRQEKIEEVRRERPDAPYAEVLAIAIDRLAQETYRSRGDGRLPYERLKDRLGRYFE